MANNITRHIPNTITCCNLISGCIAAICAIYGSLWHALLFIVIGAVFDFFDGMSARLLHVSSPIGKELDSLADVITFGLAPSTMLFHELFALEYPFGNAASCQVLSYVPYVAFVMTAFSALRLAKFNLDERQTTSFIGLPTPANALFWASLLLGLSDMLESSTWAPFVLIALMLLSCWLLVAELPMFALKFKQWGWKGNEVKYVFALSCIPLLIIFKVLAFAIIIAWYVVLSIYVNATKKQ